MLRGVRPAGWLALGQQSWRSLTTAVPLKPFEAAGGTSQASAPYHAWAAGATSATISPAVVPLPRYERNSLFGPLIGVAQVRSYGIGTTPLPERETIAYMRSVRTGTEVYLIGTAHVSKASAEEVKEVIEVVRPQYVGVELDEERAQKLMSGKMYEDRESRGLLGVLRELLHAPGDLGQKVLAVGMRSMYKMLRDTGLEPGKEFKVAIEEAHKIGAEVVMLDRPVNETMARLRQVLSLWDIVKLFTQRIDPKDIPPALRDLGNINPQNIEEKTEQLKTREAVRQVTQFMEKLFPDVVRVMVHERDEYIFNKLRQLRGTVVGVVGMAHMDGIERLWRDYEDYGVNEVEDF